MGIAAGALYIPTFENCIATVRQNGYGDCTQTYGCVSGIFQSAWSTGAFIDPTMGAMSVDYIGFAWTSALIAALNGIFLIILSCYLLKTRKSRKLSITNKCDH
uniref:Uncharacterized protein n=1 Tax=Panagrolaimus sp. JU765 TaxID=591449 RepID=A0AC34PXI3_9BILA